MDLQLNNKLVLVTGSTKGIGKAIAKNFLKYGATTIINGRSSEQVNGVIEEFSKDPSLPGKALPLVIDVSEKGSEINVGEFITSLGQPLEVLVNNVGIFDVKSFFEVPDEGWENYFNVNIMSAVRLSRHFMAGMLERKSGRILIVASEAGIRTLPLMIPYSVSKSALIGFARGLSELTKGVPGVTVNSILAGPTWTEV